MRRTERSEDAVRRTSKSRERSEHDPSSKSASEASTAQIPRQHLFVFTMATTRPDRRWRVTDRFTRALS